MDESVPMPVMGTPPLGFFAAFKSRICTFFFAFGFETFVFLGVVMGISSCFRNVIAVSHFANLQVQAAAIGLAISGFSLPHYSEPHSMRA